MGLAMWLGLWGIQKAQLRPYSAPELTLDISFQLGCFVGCAVVGAVLGVWSVLTEISPGPWAFLRHRPVSAWALFLGKLAAALTLYSAIVGLPLLIGIWWAARHLPGPWVWSMALPPLADFLSGTLFIPTGMLIAAREARWFGSRLLPVGGAILCAAATWVPWLWLAAAAFAVGWLIILPAAMSAFATRFVNSTQRWPARLLTSLTLLPAVITIPAATGAFIGDLFRLPYRNQSQWNYHIVDGNVYRVSYSGRTLAQEVVDADGRKVESAPEEDYSQLLTKKQFGGSVPLTLSIEKAGYGRGQRGYRQARDHFLVMGVSEGEWWYYVHDWGCFVGYTRRIDEPAIRIGYLGLNGVVQERSKAEPLHLKQQPTQLIGTFVEPDRILRVDLAVRKISTAFAVPAGEHGQTAGQLVRRLPDQALPALVGIAATDKAIYIHDTPDGTSLRLPHPEGYYTAEAGIRPDAASYTILYRRSVKWEDWGKPMLLVCFDRAGKELNRLELPAPPMVFYDPGSLSRAIEGIGIPQAVAFGGVIRSIRTGQPDPTALASLGAAILSAILALLALRPYPIPLRWRIFWLVVVLVIGIGGLLLMFAVRSWPPRVVCPSCHRKRLATRERCEHCAAPFPIPEPGPVGIFDQVAEPVHAES